MLDSAVSSFRAVTSSRVRLSLCVVFLVRNPLSAHLHVLLLSFVVRRDPENVVASDENLTKTAARLSIDPLLGVGKLNVHVRVDRDEQTSVLLAPLQADAN